MTQILTDHHRFFTSISGNLRVIGGHLRSISALTPIRRKRSTK
jgi:hypothetical protein